MAVISIIVGPLEPTNINELSRNILQVVDSNGSLVSEQDVGLQSFSFSPDGKKIAFIAGIRSPGRELAFNHSVGILDIRTDSVTWILDTSSVPGYTVGYEIAWPNDGHIYLSTYRKILKVNEDDFNITILDIRGSANISPDGRFLYDQSDPYIGDNIRILEIATGEDVSDSVFSVIGKYLDRSFYTIHLNWLGDVGSLLLVGVKERPNPGGFTAKHLLNEIQTYLIDIGAMELVLHKTGEKLRTLHVWQEAPALL